MIYELWLSSCHNTTSSATSLNGLCLICMPCSIHRSWVLPNRSLTLDAMYFPQAHGLVPLIYLLGYYPTTCVPGTISPNYPMLLGMVPTLRLGTLSSHIFMLIALRSLKVCFKKNLFSLDVQY